MKTTSTIILLLFVSSLSAQKEGFNWIMSTGGPSDSLYAMSVMDFNASPPAQNYHYGFFRYAHSYVIISDTAGTLACYSNGADVFNWAHEMVENGQDLMGPDYPITDICDDCHILLPYPGHPNQYMLFTMDKVFLNPIDDSYCSPLSYTIIDMNLNNGHGKVTERKIPILDEILAFYPISAVRHANGRDWWIITKKNFANVFFKVLLSPAGVSYVGEQVAGLPRQDGIDNVTFSPDGNWSATYSWWGNTNSNLVSLYLFGFDRCSGDFTSFQYKDLDDTGNGGVAFSANSRFMYVTNWDTIFQYDLQAPDIFGSEIVVASYDGFRDENDFPTRFFNPLLGPDSIIYISISGYGTRYLHTINNPDLPGLDCNVLQHSVYLPVYHVDEMPNVPWYGLGADIGSPCDSILVTTQTPKAQSKTLSITPNPGNSSTRLYYPGAGPGHWQLSDISGANILHGSWVGDSLELDLSGLVSGLYIFQLRLNKGVNISGKVLVAH